MSGERLDRFCLKLLVGDSEAGVISGFDFSLDLLIRVFKVAISLSNSFNVDAPAACKALQLDKQHE